MYVLSARMHMGVFLDLPYFILSPKSVIVNILYIKNIYALVQTKQKDICKIVGKFMRQLYDKNWEFEIRNSELF